MAEFRFSDSVAMRLVQIFQEAVLLGLDGADLLRQVRLTPSGEDPGVLVLTDQYVALVARMHAAYEARAQELAGARDGEDGGGN